MIRGGSTAMSGMPTLPLYCTVAGIGLGEESWQPLRGVVDLDIDHVLQHAPAGPSTSIVERPRPMAWNAEPSQGAST